MDSVLSKALLSIGTEEFAALLKGPAVFSAFTYSTFKADNFDDGLDWHLFTLPYKKVSMLVSMIFIIVDFFLWAGLGLFISGFKNSSLTFCEYILSFFKKIEIKEESHMAFVNDQPITLTLKEYDLLLLFLKNIGKDNFVCDILNDLGTINIASNSYIPDDVSTEIISIGISKN